MPACFPTVENILHVLFPFFLAVPACLPSTLLLCLARRVGLLNLLHRISYARRPRRRPRSPASPRLHWVSTLITATSFHLLQWLHFLMDFSCTASSNLSEVNLREHTFTSIVVVRRRPPPPHSALPLGAEIPGRRHQRISPLCVAPVAPLAGCNDFCSFSFL